MFCRYGTSLSLTYEGRTELIQGELVSGNYFPVLGVGPALGRVFTARDDLIQGAHPIAVLSYGYWKTRFAADPSVIGRKIVLNGYPLTIVGVSRQGFDGVEPGYAPQLRVPMMMKHQLTDSFYSLNNRRGRFAQVFGRLKPGVTLEQAKAGLQPLFYQILSMEVREKDFARATEHTRQQFLKMWMDVLPAANGRSGLREQFSNPLLALMAIVALVLLIACSNVANLLIARATARQKEIAVRLALGASRARLVRQLLTESMIVVAASAVPGVLASMWLLHLLSGVRMPLLIPVSYGFQPDARALTMTIALAGLTGLLFGLIPALQSTRADLASAIKEGGNVRLPGRHRFSLRNVLMVGQFAGSLTLLVILGLLSMGIQTTLGIQAGFNPKNLYLISLDPVRDGYSAAQAAAYLQKLLDRVKLLPSVTSASLTESVPVSIGSGRVRVSTPGDPAHETRTVIRHLVGKDYFETTGIAVPIGRAFRKEDETSQTGAVIVSQEFARQFWKGSDPLGRRIEIGSDALAASGILPGSFDYRVGAAGARRRIFEVVGVAGDVAEGLVVQTPSPAMYFPLQAEDYARPPAQGFTLMVRAAPGVDAVGAVRREMSALDANVTPFNIRSMPEQIEQFMAPLRSSSWTYALIGIFGLVLSAVGLAGMTAYSVAQRGREIGIRIALGAQRGNVLGLVMKEGLWGFSLWCPWSTGCCWNACTRRLRTRRCWRFCFSAGGVCTRREKKAGVISVCATRKSPTPRFTG
jgi:predicted permease